MRLQIGVRILAITAISAIVGADAISIKAESARKASNPSFSKEVSRIMQRKCQSCHRDDGVAPFTLLNYDQVKAKAQTIKTAVASGRMPPWLADPKYGKFENNRSLSAEDRSTLLSWLDSGLPKG